MVVAAIATRNVLAVENGDVGVGGGGRTDYWPHRARRTTKDGRTDLARRNGADGRMQFDVAVVVEH